MSKITKIISTFAPKTELLQTGRIIVQTTIHNARPAAKTTANFATTASKPDVVVLKDELHKGFQAFKISCKKTADVFFASKSELKQLKEKYADLQALAEEKNQLERFKDCLRGLGETYLGCKRKEKQIIGNMILGRLLKLYKGKSDIDLKATASISKKLVRYHESQGDLGHAHERIHYVINAYDGLIKNTNEKLLKIELEKDKKPQRISVNLTENLEQKEKTKAQIKQLKTSLKEYKKERYQAIKKAIRYSQTILSDYDKYSEKYNAATSIMQTKEAIEIDIAYLLSQLSICLAHEKRNKAIEHLLEAKQIYAKYNKQKESRFTDVQISRIKTSEFNNKLQEYPRKLKTRTKCQRTEKALRNKTLKIKKRQVAAYSRFEESQVLNLR